MSEHDNGGESDASYVTSELDGTNNEHVGDPHVRNFIRYSDDVDKRMMGMINRRKEQSEINFSSWERRGDFYDLSSESEEESSPPSIPQKYPTLQEGKEGSENGAKSDNSFARKNAIEKQYQQQNEEMLVNERSCPSKAQELVKKFNTIELLREKESLKQADENEMPEFSFLARRDQQENEDREQKTNLEEFFGRKRLGKKHRDMWKGKEITSDNSDESDKEIDELVELLSSTSLIKIYDENLALPKEEDEILKTFLQSEEKENPTEGSNEIHRKKTVDSLIDIFENLPETESKETSKVQSLNDESVWKADELCTSFDGYDIDNQSSFHDWMLEEILSKSLNISSEPEITVCSKCFSFHDHAHECFQE